MKSVWDNDHNCRIFTCHICGHVYHEYYDYNQQQMNKEEPFIEMAEVLLFEKDRDWGPKELVRCRHYACPKCGVLQIDTSEM